MYDMAQLQYYWKSNTLKYKKLLDIIFEKEDVKTTKIISNNFLDTELLKVYKAFEEKTSNRSYCYGDSGPVSHIVRLDYLRPKMNKKARHCMYQLVLSVLRLTPQID